MNGLQNLFDMIGNLAAAAFSSAMFAVFAGVLAKHSMEVQAGRYPFLGTVLYAKLPVGFFLYYVAIGISSYSGFSLDTRNAVAALIGMAGPELVLALALRFAKARGLISDVPDSQQGKGDGK